MTTIKSYTDIEQSKKLAEILLLESADMWYQHIGFSIKDGSERPLYFPMVIRDCESDEDIPCWSLAALLSILPKIINNETLFIETSAALWHIGYRNIYTARADNPLDACMDMILKLHELNLL